MRKVITFNDDFLNFEGSVDLLRNIKQTAESRGEELVIALRNFVGDPRPQELKDQGIIDYVMTVDNYQDALNAVGIGEHTYVMWRREMAAKNKGNPDWNLLAKAASDMGLPSDEPFLHRLHDNLFRWHQSEQTFDTAYFSPLFFMVGEDDRGMTADYDWGIYKRYDNSPWPLFERVDIHMQGNRNAASYLGTSLLEYPSEEIMQILEQVQTGKTSEGMLRELEARINVWDGFVVYQDIGKEWGIYTEGSPIYRQAESWLRGETGVQWRQNKERR